MSKFEYFQDGDDIAAEDGPPPFTQVPDWVLLSGCSAQAFRMYVFLAAHIDPRDPRAKVPCPKQDAIAKALGLSNPRQVAPYGHELERLGALRIEKYRYASGMRNGYRYRVRFNPPNRHAGPIRMKDFYLANPGVRIDPAPGRLQVGALGSPDGGTKNSTPGRTENSTPQGTEISTSQGTTDGTSRGTAQDTPQGAPDRRPQTASGNTPEGAAYGPLEGAADRSAKEDQGGADQGGAETSPTSVVTAEERASARGGEEQKGAAAPHDPSPAAAGGTEGASPTGGPAVAKSASTEQRFGHMAADVVRTLPLVLQPATGEEREALRWLIADKLSEGYPVGIVRQALNADPPEYVKAKAAFIGHRLSSMAPWVPPARSAADTAAVDEIRSRQAEQAGTAPPQSAAAARAAFEASRGRRPGRQD